MSASVPPSPLARNRIRRLVLFVACIFIGILVGVIGSRITGSDHWYLAIPALLAVVWFIVADPDECQRCSQPPAGRTRPNRTPDPE
jgi:quinol-cytochrome oxidoreductase complex cytochrome b subunit